MNYILIGSLRSPFVRMIRLLLVTHNIPYEFKVIDYLENSNDAAFLKTQNPLNKIPILIAGENKIYDSRVIFNYLTKQHILLPLTLLQENVLTAVIGMLDVYVNLYLLKRGGLDTDSPSWYIDRQKARIAPALNYILPWVKTLNPSTPTDWNFVSMTLYSFLYWARAREFLNLKDYPDLIEFLDKFKNAPGVEDTSFKA
jgi:glutathione S-transferase